MTCNPSLLFILATYATAPVRSKIGEWWRLKRKDAAASCITAGWPLPVFCLYEHTYFGDTALLVGTEPAVVYGELCCKPIKKCFSQGLAILWCGLTWEVWKRCKVESAFCLVFHLFVAQSWSLPTYLNSPVPHSSVPPFLKNTWSVFRWIFFQSWHYKTHCSSVYPEPLNKVYWNQHKLPLTSAENSWKLKKNNMLRN